MNLFKVLSSGDKGFQEEHASALLLWLLNPYMEHGLSFAFLREFLREIADKPNSNLCQMSSQTRLDLKTLIAVLRPRLRSAASDSAKVQTDLEHNVTLGFLDVLVCINGKLNLVIENKIRASCAQDAAQLAKQYQGIKQSKDYGANPTIMVFLVPSQGAVVDKANGVSFHSYILEEYQSLQTIQPDDKIIMSWQASEIYPSLHQVISAVLEAEKEGRIEPVPEYTRHTLKALRCFVADSFRGYEFERVRSAAGLNPMTEEILDPDLLLQRDEGFVGVQHGISGLLGSIMLKTIARSYQFTRQNMELKKNWIPIGRFKALVKWARNTQAPLDIRSLFHRDDKKLSLASDTIHWLSCQNVVPPFLVGIKGGSGSLGQMTSEDIEGTKWKIGGPENDDGQRNWISSSKFRELYERIIPETDRG